MRFMLGKGFLCILVLVLISHIQLCYAQNKRYYTEKEYVISSNDLLEITVYGEPDLNVTLRVSQDGKINYPLLGSIKAAGLTVLDLERTVTYLLAEDYLVRPQVNIIVKEHAKISILGQVRIPGSYEIKENLTLTQAIAIAGGFTDTANMRKVKIIRSAENRKETLYVNVAKIIDKASVDVEIRANDIIVVEEYGKISILGQVRKPGSYEIKENLTLTQAIAIAGGFTEMANTRKVKIIRSAENRKETMEVDVQKIIDEERLDIELEPDDTIIVEEETGRISIMGQVIRPGVYNLKKGLTAIEAISLAGGFTPTAAQDGTRIIRVEGGEKRVIRVRISDIIRGIDKTTDITLQDGDTIVVPESFF